MERIRFLSSIAGDGFVCNTNDVVEIKAEEAARLIKAGIAVKTSDALTYEKPKGKKPKE